MLQTSGTVGYCLIKTTVMFYCRKLFCQHRSWTVPGLFRQVTIGVDRLAIVPQLEVQAYLFAFGVTHFGNFLPLSYRLAFFDRDRAVVRIDAEVAGSMVYDDKVAIAT